jgi:hypothetical protein
VNQSLNASRWSCGITLRRYRRPSDVMSRSPGSGVLPGSAMGIPVLGECKGCTTAGVLDTIGVQFTLNRAPSQAQTARCSIACACSRGIDRGADASAPFVTSRTSAGVTHVSLLIHKSDKAPDGNCNRYASDSGSKPNDLRYRSNHRPCRHVHLRCNAFRASLMKRKQFALYEHRS